MKRLLLASALLTLLILPASGKAEQLNYSYLEGGYSQLDPDGGAPDADGIAANGSVLLGEQWFLYGGYASHEFDGTSVDVDVQRIGLGWRHGLGNATDLVLGANYLRFDVDGTGIGLDSDGYEAEVGVRHAFGKRFEVQASLGYVDGGDFDGSVYGKLGGQYRFNQDWGLVGSALIRDDANEYFFGPRLSF